MIGVFDSGVGGLTVLSAIQKRLPDVPLVYLADQRFAPYGDLPQAQVAKRSEQIVRWLIGQGCELVVVACNTATALAIDSMRESLTTPLVGVEPGVKPAALNSRSRRVGILATANTVTSERYQRLLQRFVPDVEVISQACPGLVDAIEQCSDEVEPLLQQFCQPLRQQGVDQVVLGCTHYPLLKNQILDLFENGVAVIDTSDAVANEVARRYIGGHGNAITTLYTTADAEQFQRVISGYPSLNWLQGIDVQELTLDPSAAY